VAPTLTHSLTRLAADIFLVERLLDPALCDHIVQVAECCPFETADIDLSRVDMEVRSNDLLRLGGANPLLRSTNELLAGKIVTVQQLLLQEYGVLFPHVEAFTILRYQSGQYYKRHVDNLLLASRYAEIAHGVPTRDVSVIGYLNEDCQGGETYFDRQDLKVQPQKGSVLLFPAYYTYPHQSLPVLEGKKYSFTTWLFH